jgi:hypothetical protein
MVAFFGDTSVLFDVNHSNLGLGSALTAHVRLTVPVMNAYVLSDPFLPRHTGLSINIKHMFII